MVRKAQDTCIEYESTEESYLEAREIFDYVSMRVGARLMCPFRGCPKLEDEEIRLLAKYSGSLIGIYMTIDRRRKQNLAVDKKFDRIARKSKRLNEKILKLLDVYGAYEQ